MTYTHREQYSLIENENERKIIRCTLHKNSDVQSKCFENRSPCSFSVNNRRPVLIQCDRSVPFLHSGIIDVSCGIHEINLLQLFSVSWRHYWLAYDKTECTPTCWDWPSDVLPTVGLFRGIESTHPHRSPVSDSRRGLPVAAFWG